MNKKICIKYFPYNIVESFPPIQITKSFLFWKWKETKIPKKFKYKNKNDLLEDVNNFIKTNGINQIISFKNTAEDVSVTDGFSSFCYDREGGISITYFG